MSRKRKYRPDRFGYEPDEHLAGWQMEDVVRALNQTRIMTSGFKAWRAIAAHRGPGEDAGPCRGMEGIGSKFEGSIQSKPQAC